MNMAFTHHTMPVHFTMVIQMNVSVEMLHDAPAPNKWYLQLCNFVSNTPTHRISNLDFVYFVIIIYGAKPGINHIFMLEKFLPIHMKLVNESHFSKLRATNTRFHSNAHRRPHLTVGDVRLCIPGVPSQINPVDNYAVGKTARRIFTRKRESFLPIFILVAASSIRYASSVFQELSTSEETLPSLQPSGEGGGRAAPLWSEGGKFVDIREENFIYS